MSLQFICGPVGSNKSKYVQEMIIRQSRECPDKHFLLVVPDQFNMQTQMEMIRLHPDRAFSNIEVLSFSRLSHRILEEVGGENIPVLDDTGKSLIIRLVAEQVRDKLHSIRKRLDSIGYIHEVKSVISEFLQYGLSYEDVDDLISFASSKPLLADKLRDINIIYEAFENYKEDKFLTREETLDVVRRSLHNSDLVKNSLIVFDGFTGFTPIQERVIEGLMLVADKVVMSFDMEVDSDPSEVSQEQELFYLSATAIKRLRMCANKLMIPEEETIYLQNQEYKESGQCEEISHLSANIFRYPYKTWNQETTNIQIYSAKRIRDEITDTCSRIRQLTDTQGMSYRDIAIVVGNLGEYADDLSEIATEFGIPIYMDYSKSVTLSPFIEALRSVFDIVTSNFGREALMRYLRCGFSPLDKTQCDELENFLLKTGIRGYRSYQKVWTVNYSGFGEESEAHRELRLAKAERINGYREQLLLHLKPILETADKASIETYARAMYEYMRAAQMQGRLQTMSDEFERSGDLVRASEYKQIYIKVMDLLDQMVSISGDEIVEREAFAEILDAGYGEIKLGVIPQEVDTVIACDMERSRLSDIRVLFFMGVNDGNIPGGISGGGIISDLDRDFLKQSEFTLAPTPREQIFTQRLYLYLNLSKPKEKLIISYAQMDSAGKSLRPSYLINNICKLFPAISIRESSSTHTSDGWVMPAGKHLISLSYANLIREKAIGRDEDTGCNSLYTLSTIMDSHDMDGVRRRLDEIAFEYAGDERIASGIASLLYGKVIRTSVSRFERFASCAYAHFLSYGMALRKREEFGFENTDLGEIYHRILEGFAGKLQEEHLSWMDYTADQSHAWIDEMLEDVVATYGETVLLSSARTQAMTRRMSRILKRTVDNLQYQLSHGDFVPDGFEQFFSNIHELTLDNTGDTVQMKITGKIDRIDVAIKDDHLHVKIIDYKSGNRDFDLSAVYNGLQLQLAVYMKQAMELEKKAHADLDVVSSAMLYYHLDDPMLDLEPDVNDEIIADSVHSALKMKGIVTRGEELLIDNTLSEKEKSDIIPVSIKRNGEYAKSSKILEKDDMQTVLDYADTKMDLLATEILNGVVSINPKCMTGGYLPCDYCDYKTICRVNSRIPGYESEKLSKEDEELILERMRDELHQRSE